MSESLRNDGRIWVPAKKEDAEKVRKGQLKPNDIPEAGQGLLPGKALPGFR